MRWNSGPTMFDSVTGPRASSDTNTDLPSAVWPVTPRRLGGGQDVGQFGLAVHAHTPVALRVLEIVEVEPTARAAVGARRDVDDARRRAGLDAIEQQVGEEERPQVVDREGALQSVDG